MFVFLSFSKKIDRSIRTERVRLITADANFAASEGIFSTVAAIYVIVSEGHRLGRARPSTFLPTSTHHTIDTTSSFSVRRILQEVGVDTSHTFSSSMYRQYQRPKE
jgi:hypothetical protein